MIPYEAPDERPISPKKMADFHTTALKTWIGGTRQMQESWSEAQNWFPVGVPSWTDKVIIGGYGRHRCVVDGPVDDVSALAVLPGAKLVVERRGRLAIDGLFADPLGLLGDSGLHIQGILQVRGQLSLRNAALRGIRNTGLLINEGQIFADSTISADDADWGHYADRGARVFTLRGGRGVS